MITQKTIEEILTEQSTYVILDVRSPGEFLQGHIPSAINLPLFSDEERATVGTAYKMRGPDEAMRIGLSIVGPKMEGLVEQAKSISDNHSLLLHCWRGGKRSGSVAWLLDFAGLPVTVLKDGYKGYRRNIRQWLDTTAPHFIVLGGPTGSGKTEMLKQLAQMGEQVLDLEGLANHKGSAFGWIGENPQPTTEQFENDIFEVLIKFDLNKRIWVENESRTIGKVFIPELLWDLMRISPLVHVEVPVERRVQNLVDTYAESSLPSDLEVSFVKITQRLGGQHVKTAITAIKDGDYHTAAKIALTYYDKAYYFGIENSPSKHIEKLHLGDKSMIQIAETLLTSATHIELQTVDQ